MAILVEEEKNNYARFSGIIAWAVVGAVIALGIYYVFFKRPEIIEFATPAGFQEVESLLEIKIAPQEIIENPVFQGLDLHAPSLNPKTQGKSNPFLAQ